MRSKEPSIQVASAPFPDNVGSEQYWNGKFREWEKRRGIKLFNDRPHGTILRGAAKMSAIRKGNSR